MNILTSAPSLRSTQRSSLAKKVCNLSYGRLSEYGISRSADVTGLDSIGLPVYTTCRPPGKVITISSGKGLNRIDAKAGSILEGIELWAAENPHGEWSLMDYLSAKKAFERYLPIEMFAHARDSILNESTQIAWELVEDVFHHTMVAVPSDLVWLKERIKQPFTYFQTSSNGIASGIDYEDALLQACYELIERDGWAIHDFVRDETGQWPERVSLNGPLPHQISQCLDRLYNASVTPFVFDLSTEIGVPVFSCVLIESTDSSPGVFGGYGASLDSGVALRRAITEAAQARCCYISGARDDMFRRKFLLLKNVQHRQLFDLYDSITPHRLFCDYPQARFDTIKEEWEEVSDRMQSAGISECYSKILYQSGDPGFVVLRVITPQLESPVWESWAPGPRAKKAINVAV